MVSNAKRAKTQHAPKSSGVDLSAALDAFAPAEGDMFQGSPSSLDWSASVDMWNAPQQAPFTSMGPPLAPTTAASSSSNLLPPQGPPSSNDVALSPVPEVAPLPKRKKAEPKSRKRKSKASNAEAEVGVEAEIEAPPPPKAGKRGAATKSVSATPASLAPVRSTSAMLPPTANQVPLPSPMPPLTPVTPAASWSQRQASLSQTSQSQFQPPGSQSQSQAQASQAQASQVAPNDGVDDLQDVMGQSGVDLRAEEERMQHRFQPSTNSYTAPSQTSTTFGSSTTTLELYPLAIKVHSIASKHGLSVEPEVLNYLSLAAKVRFRALLSGMISASRHRAWSTHQRVPPTYEAQEEQAMFHVEVHREPSVALAALERVERVQEQAARKLRIERDEREANAALLGAEPGSGGDADMADGSGSGTPLGATKRKPVSQAAQAKNMSEEVRRRLANNTAARQLGGAASTPKWMSLVGAAAHLTASHTGTPDSPSPAGTGGTLSSLPKPRFAPLATGLGTVKPSHTPGGAKREWSLAPSTLGTTSSANGAFSLGAATTQSTGGWADLSARQRQREAEERKRHLAVTLPDALHALDMERAAGKGKGSGEVAAYKARAKGFAGPRPMHPENL